MKREQLDGAGGPMPGLSDERTCLGPIFEDGLRSTYKIIPDYALASAGLGMLWNKTRTTDLQRVSHGAQQSSISEGYERG
ncbi:MAG: hypothetical protein WCC41_11775, partial [Rhodomicrobium sp.]